MNVCGRISNSETMKAGTCHISRPIRNSVAVRRQILASAARLGWCLNDRSENQADTPIAKRNDGNTRSVGVKPCQCACCNGPQETSPLPGVLTMIIRAMVMPRKMSSARMRDVVVPAAAALTEGEGLNVDVGMDRRSSGLWHRGVCPAGVRAAMAPRMLLGERNGHYALDLVRRVSFIESPLLWPRTRRGGGATRPLCPSARWSAGVGLGHTLVYRRSHRVTDRCPRFCGCSPLLPSPSSLPPPARSRSRPASTW